MNRFGFLRVAACSPELVLANPQSNADASLKLLEKAGRLGVDLAVFPECGLTGYTCHDLFHQKTLTDATETALAKLIEDASNLFRGLFTVGLPVRLDGQLFNAAAVIASGRLLGVVPKTHLPNYGEFYDGRYFAPAASARSQTITLAGFTVPFGTDLLFQDGRNPQLTFGVEICEDLWVTIPPSSHLALAGATVLANLSASNEVIGKAAYRKQLVAEQSARCLAGYVYASCGSGESTTDLTFGGHCLIAENGTIIEEARRAQTVGGVVAADLDLDRLVHERLVNPSFAENRRQNASAAEYRTIAFSLGNNESRQPELLRAVDAHPFVPSDPATLGERCHDILTAQVDGLTRRLQQVGNVTPVIGVSGGVDSTLALLVLGKALDRLGRPRADALGITMPGFGTTPRTLNNSRKLLKSLGLTAKEIDIRELSLLELLSLGHRPFGIPLEGHTVDSFVAVLKGLAPEQLNDLTFENVQARVRTSLLMNSGFVVGTGDLSELALGWCTYNADHMSMYNPNVSIPKTLAKFLIRHAANTLFEGEVREVLADVLGTPVSPELLPTNDDAKPQSTESTIGPYELHDFFLYHFLRFGTPPEKILYLAGHTQFDKPYTADELRRWLRLFLQRFFQNQFKRSCLPDGPKVGTVSLSPRGDWRMPSDANAQAWLANWRD